MSDVMDAILSDLIDNPAGIREECIILRSSLEPIRIQLNSRFEFKN